MFCSNCGRRIPNVNANFCQFCGAKIDCHIDDVVGHVSELEDCEAVSLKCSLKKNPKKIEEYKTKIHSWVSFYLTIAIINIFIYVYAVIETRDITFLALMFFPFVMGILAYLLLVYKNLLIAKIFLVYYIILFMITVGAMVLVENNKMGSVLLLVGLIGAFKCYSHVKKIV